MKQKRNRLIYAVLIAIVIAAGLFSRSAFSSVLPDFVATYAGDTLWALCLYLVLGFIFPTARIFTITATCLLLSYAVEFGQLYDAEWFHPIRYSTLGKLTLGSGFLPSDFICYTAGCLLGTLGEWLRHKRYA